MQWSHSDSRNPWRIGWDLIWLRSVVGSRSQSIRSTVGHFFGRRRLHCIHISKESFNRTRPTVCYDVRPRLTTKLAVSVQSDASQLSHCAKLVSFEITVNHANWPLLLMLVDDSVTIPSQAQSQWWDNLRKFSHLSTRNHCDASTRDVGMSDFVTF